MKISFLFHLIILVTLCQPALSQKNDVKKIILEKEQAIREHEEEIKKWKNELNDLKCGFIREELKMLGYPADSDEGELIEHYCMVLKYIEKHEQSKWVFYSIIPDITEGNETRSNDFRVDTMVSAETAVEQDYFLTEINPDGQTEYDGFGFDRGHLAASADFRWNSRALSESYFYSNISPQRPEFNRGIWAELEDFMRNYVVRTKNPVFIVTGGILLPDLPVIDRSINKVSIPYHYYKIAIDVETGRGIGFIIPNRAGDYDLEKYACPIDSIESVTGIDFFPDLPKEKETQLEAAYLYKDWFDEKGKKYAEPLNPETMPKNTFNTLQAKLYVNSGKKITVCGTVVSTFKSKKGNVFLDLDRTFPDQVFSASIFKDNLVHFSYNPHTELEGKRVCLTGTVGDYKTVPSMSLAREKQVKVLESESGQVGKWKVEK